MKNVFNLRFLFASVVLTLVLGCEQVQKDSCDVAPPTAPKVDATKAPEQLGVSSDDLESSKIDIEDLNAPEGVVDSFFKAFFSGDDDGAFQFLTSKAQNAKRGAFLTQESDCVSWRIIGKTKPVDGRVKVLVELEDYDEVGEFQTDRLTFLLTFDDFKWRIARFEIGEIEVDFEEQGANSSPVARTVGSSVNATR